MSHALEQFPRSLVYGTQATAQQILDDLTSIRGLDKTHESEAKKFGCIGGLLVPVTIAALPLSMALPWIGMPLLLVAGGGAATLLTKAYRANKQNVEDRRYELLRSVVELISRDVAPETPLRVEMSLRPASRKENFQTSGQAGLWKFELYHDPWLSLDLRLLDGTACRVQLTERLQCRKRWKRSRSGKRKLKQKRKSVLEVVVRLKPKTHRYSHLSEIGPAAQGAVQLPEWGVLKGLAVDDGGLAMKAATKAEWDAPRKGEQGTGPHGVHLVAMMLLSLYQVLNLSRAITKAERTDP